MGAKVITAMQAAIDRQNQLTARFKKARVLIIEDSAEARGMLRGTMRDSGAEKIDLAVSGQEGIDAMRSRHYDVVLCDYNLGKGKDGQQVLEEARFSQYLRYSTIFIMITAETSVEMVMGALEYQPDSYLSKPYTKNELMSRLNRALRSKIEYRSIEDLFEKKQFDQAIQLCDEKIAEGPERPMRACRIKGECLFKLKQYAAAKSLFSEVLKERELAWANIGLGKTLYYLRDFEAGADIFRKLIAEQPDVVESYDWLARILIALRRAREAQDILENAVLKSPKAVLRQMELAKLALANRSYLVAEKSYRKSITLASNSCYHSPTNYLQYVRTLLVKIDQSHSQVSREAFAEAKLFLMRLRKEFDNQREINFKAYMLESLVYHNHGDSNGCDKAVKLAKGIYAGFDVMKRELLAEEYVSNLTLVGRIEESQEFIHELQKSSNKPELANKLLARVADGKRRLHSESLNIEAMELYEKGAIMEAHEKFSEAASTKGATASVLLNAVSVCVELAEREDLNKDEWRKECRAYLERLEGLDRCDHRYALFVGFRDRFHQLS